MYNYLRGWMDKRKRIEVCNENICVNKTQIQHKEQSYAHIINNYTKLDPTLPRTKSIKCPNKSCTAAEQGGQEVIYLRYDDKNMKYMYLCCHCDYNCYLLSQQRDTVTKARTCTLIYYFVHFAWRNLTRNWEEMYTSQEKLKTCQKLRLY